MKSYFLPVVALVILFIGTDVHAQRPPVYGTVNSGPSAPVFPTAPGGPLAPVFDPADGGPSIEPIENRADFGTPEIDTAEKIGSGQIRSCSKIEFKSLLDILKWAKCIILVAIIPILFSLALMFFLWGVMNFVRASDSTKQAEGRKFIIAGLIGLFVMTSLWGIISIVGTTLGTGSVVPVLQTTTK